MTYGENAGGESSEDNLYAETRTDPDEEEQTMTATSEPVYTDTEEEEEEREFTPPSEPVYSNQGTRYCVDVQICKN